jgi:hypothetical protein
MKRMSQGNLIKDRGNKKIIIQKYPKLRNKINSSLNLLKIALKARIKEILKPLIKWLLNPNGLLKLDQPISLEQQTQQQQRHV